MHADLLAPFVLTYLLHSTLLLGAAWCAVRLWRRMPLAMQESLWRTALFGGVLTASAQLAIGWEPWSGRLDVPPLDPPPPAAALHTGEAPLAPVETPDAVVAAEPALTLFPSTPPEAEPAAPLRIDPALLLGALWCIGFAVLCVRAHRARRGLRRRLAVRAAGAADLVRRLDALRAAAGVRRRIRLSSSEHVGGPVALGILRPEIVVPARAAHELADDEQEVMLAHELAHHVRHDPLWLACTRFVRSVLFFQPLNHLAARRLRETSELLCDAWAAERTGQGRALAECLTKVAGWMVHARGLAAVPAMAAEGSMLERRVERLLDAENTAARRHRVGSLLAIVPLAAVAAFAPVVASGATPAPEPEAPAAGPAITRIEVAPEGDVERALALLDREIAELNDELTVLIGLLRQVQDAPEALRHGVARLEARLQALNERRVALRGDAQEMKR